ncbi:MAG: aldehyde dehydrogenase [Roseovarius sp. BRH_c41]|uniref:thiamine pyrophosphate-dependent enzyme n=1 Tax=Roseovarius sp. BRH_c41 TaxID=1629709 RepID=UPI0005F1FBA8|nr:thiamine pyrophosphate-dependent enzyme [Roseovarius sp. BRH_c41]KJS43134.1 MAG: aldehyde dehydrogenase [Roseovarius sp. BRH_c41]
MDQVIKGGTLPRREVVAGLLENRDRMLVVTGLGSASYDVMAAGDHDNNYYLWAAMGSAVTVGFGLAMAQPERPVVVITGDGELMMGLGALASVALKKPANLTIAVLDNGHFGETGMQESHAGRGIAIDQIAASMGFPHTQCITDEADLPDFRDSLETCGGLRLAVLKIKPGNEPRVLPSRDGVHIKNRFRGALGFQPI